MFNEQRHLGAKVWLEPNEKVLTAGPALETSQMHSGMHRDSCQPDLEMEFRINDLTVQKQTSILCWSENTTLLSFSLTWRIPLWQSAPCRTRAECWFREGWSCGCLQCRHRSSWTPIHYRGEGYKRERCYKTGPTDFNRRKHQIWSTSKLSV